MGSKRKDQGSVADLLEEIPAAAEEEEASSSPVAAYEKELRDRLSSAPPPEVARRRRTLEAVVIVGALVVLAVVAFQRQGQKDEERRDEATRYIVAAANGLARDTRSAYDASAEALRAALALAPDRGDAKAMLAQALATLATVYGSGEADRAQAATLVEEADPEHEATLLTRWILVGADPEGREALEDEVLFAAADGGGAAIQSLAGEILLGRGDSALAIDRFNQAMQGMPGHVPTLVRIGEYYRDRKEYAEAGRYYDLALAVAEEHVPALLGAAEAHLSLGAEEQVLEEALKDLGRIRGEEQVPVELREKRHLIHASLHLALGDREAAQARLRQLPPGLPPPALARQVVETMVEAGAPQAANALFDTFLPSEGSDPRHREAYVRALLAKQAYRKATSVFARQGERELLVLQGIAWFHLGELDRAQTTLRSARRDGKLPVDAIVYLAWIDAEQGRTGRARRNLERFGSGTKARTTGSLAYASYLMGQNELPLAEQVLKDALARAPHAAELHGAWGDLHQLLGREEEAAAAWQEALSLNPFLVEPRTELAKHHFERGALAQAREQWRILAQERPESGEAMAGLGLVQWREGERERGVRTVEGAIELAPREAGPLLARARMYQDEGMLAQAEQLVARAVGLEPQDADLWARLGALRLAAGDAKGAGAAYLRSARERRGWIPARIGRARALVGEGRAILAARQLRGILDELGKVGREAERAFAHAALGEAMLAQGKGFATTARQEAEEALALVDELPLAYLVLATASDALGDTSSAATYHERLEALTPNLPDAVIARARHLKERGEDEEAVSAYERYLELAPRGLEARAARRELASLR